MSRQFELSPVPGFLASLPDPIARLLGGSLAGGLASTSVLHDEVAAYLVYLDKASESDEFIDRETALRLAARCYALLAKYDKLAIDDARYVIQAAVRYFVLHQDYQSDTSSLVGFDDDELVVAAAEKALGLGSSKG